MKHLLLVVFLLICLFSCQSTKEKQAERILNDWIDKEIIFPENLNFSIQGTDELDFSINDSEYKIVVYVDSVGCTSCKLHLFEWEHYINYVDSIHPNKVQFLFFFFPKNGRDIYLTLRADSKIKQLYLNIISGWTDLPLLDNQSLTSVLFSLSQIKMGSFSWEEEQEGEIRVSNTGKVLLVINDVITSCGCTTVGYSKKPVLPGENMTLKISYKAEQPGYFIKR